MKYGLVNKIIETGQYIFGEKKLPKIVLQPTGQWEEFLPDYERQFTDSFDSYCCTVFGTLNCIETLDRRLFNKKSDYSERYIANIVPVRDPGSDPHKVAEAIRTKGVLEQHELPFTETLEEFTTPMPITAQLLLKGFEWIKEYDFRHEWLWSGNLSKEDKVDRLKEALKYSPVGISVTAWNLENGVYVDAGAPNNHWCELIGFYDIAGQFLPKVFDSYDQTIKILDKDHEISMAKRYHLQKRGEKRNMWITLLYKIFKWKV